MVAPWQPSPSEGNLGGVWLFGLALVLTALGVLSLGVLKERLPMELGRPVPMQASQVVRELGSMADEGPEGVV